MVQKPHFGGVVSGITKQGDETPKFNGLAGSYEQSNFIELAMVRGH